MEFNIVRPYLAIEIMIRETGELYFDIDSVTSREEIKKYNSSLDQWECSNGFMINEKKAFYPLTLTKLQLYLYLNC